MIRVNPRGMLAITPTITAITPKKQGKKGLTTTAVQNYQLKVSEVETSRYDEMNTESRVRGRPYSVHAPRGRGFLKCVHSI